MAIDVHAREVWRSLALPFDQDELSLIATFGIAHEVAEGTHFLVGGEYIGRVATCHVHEGSVN